MSGCGLKLPVLLLSSVVVVVVGVDVKSIEPSGTGVLLLYKIIFVIFCSQTEETFHKEGYFQFNRYCQNKPSFKISKPRK